MICRHFSHSMGPFLMLIAPFDARKILIFVKSDLSIFFFRCLRLWYHIQRITADSKVTKVSTSSFKSFTVLAPTLKSLIHFELTSHTV